MLLFRRLKRLEMTTTATLLLASSWFSYELHAEPLGEKPLQPTAISVAAPKPTTGESSRPQRALDYLLPTVAPASPAPATQLGGGLAKTTAVQPASFMDVYPGQTTVDEARATLGNPIEQRQEDGALDLVYQVGPFRQVELLSNGHVVQSIVLHLAEHRAPAELCKELQLDAELAVQVHSSSGELLGEVHPERGILFSYTPESLTPQVAQVLIEPLTADAFVLRAEKARGHRYQSILDDLHQARSLDPEHARAAWLQAVTLKRLERYSEASKAADQACLAQPDDREYQLTQITLTGLNGRRREALAQLEKLAEQVQASNNNLLKARVHLQLGRLLAAGWGLESRRAIDEQRKAIDLALASRESTSAAERQAAREILVEAHLSVASIVAKGRWQNKGDVIKQWVDQAQQLAAGAGRQADPVLKLSAYRRSLEAYATAGEVAHLQTTVRAAEAEGNRLLESVKDPLLEERIRSELSDTLRTASRMARAIGDSKQASEFAREAFAIIEPAVAQNESPRAARLKGSICFELGLIHALLDQDHERAVEWYEQALAQFDGPSLPAIQHGEHGDQLVSMGLSYWEAGQKDRGLELTEQGLQLLQSAVNDGVLDASALSIPQANLIAMRQTSDRTTIARKPPLGGLFERSEGTRTDLRR